jgi:heparin/heparan-sulfate lyase
VAENKAGRLTSLTLLPDHAKIERIGGPGREAWVDGKNHPFETTKTLGPEFTTGSWRLEISPAAPQLRDTFLHVLWVDDATSPAVNPAAARLMKTADSVSVRVGGWTVQFPLDRTGKSTVVATR